MPRGKKSCPKCNASVGPRLRVCECGHEFAFKQGSPSRRKPPAIPGREKPREDLSDDPSTVVGVTDRDELREFIQQLQSCYDRSHANGGGYSAFLHHKTGKLEVDVCLEMKLR